MNNELCIALGDFDGVHLGHQAVINATVNNEYGLTPAVYTFSTNCKGAKLITDNDRKILLLKQLGIKRIILDEFDKIKHLSPTEFVDKVLISNLAVKAVVCGNDYRFGKNAEGNKDILKQLCDRNGILFNSIDILNYTNEKISSSDIRRKIECGDMENANRLLGRRYAITGTVEHGKQLGSRNNTPTVNLSLKQNCVIPAYGVYITKTKINDRYYNSISNVGVRPSVENTDIPNIETNLFDFNYHIYGCEITVEFIKRLRSELKFENRNELFTQIKQDINTAKVYFNGETNE